MMTWLMSVVLTAFAVSVARQLTPGKREEALVSLAGGLLLLAALLRLPAAPPEWEELMAVETAIFGETERALREESTLALAEIIEEKTAAYIYDKSRELQWEGEVTVETVCTDSGIPLPQTAILSGPYCQALSLWLDREVGIPPQRQNWVEGSNGEGT